MTIELLLPLIAVFVLGAMSPGPSLAVVLRNSLAGGRRHGVLTGIGHGFGFGIYAFLAAIGMVAVIASSEALSQGLRWTGIALLVYLGIIYARSAFSRDKKNTKLSSSSTGRSGFIEGMLIAILNPKILAWMLAIYSPFIDSDFSTPTLLGIAAVGMFIDSTWYTSVALFLTSNSRSAKLRSISGKIDGAMAVLMIVFATVLGTDLLSR